MDEILTIVIPTYNRPQNIKVQHASLLPQLTDAVKLIIIDNNSKIPVSSLIDNSHSSKVKVIRNPINIGGAANIARCFEICDTEWLWTLSDDDVIEVDAVEKILTLIKNLNDVCYVNFNNKRIYSSNNFSDILDNGGLYQDYYYMSVCVYNVSKLKNHIHHYYRALSTMQPAIYMLIKYLADTPNDKCMISNIRIISAGSPDISWNRMTFLYASLYLVDLLQDMKSEFKSNLFKSIIADCGFCAYDSYIKGYISFWRLLISFIHMIKRRGIYGTLIYDVKVYIKYIGLCLLRPSFFTCIPKLILFK